MRYFKLPDLGEGLPEADILEWHIGEGDTVSEGQLLVSVETAKAIVEVPSPQAGTIAHLFGAPGDTLHTGEPLVEFVSDGQETDAGTVVGEISSATASSSQDTFIIGAAASCNRHTHPQATPAVRALATRLGVDLASVRGSGPGGRITAEDIERAARLDQSHGQAEHLSGPRKQMARTMALAHQQVVPVTLFDEVDIAAWPADTDITLRLIRAIAAGCQTEPALNAWFDGEQLSRRLHKQIDLAIAVDTTHGLFVPVLRDIATRAPENLRQGLDRLRADILARTIPPSEMQGATFTLSNFGTHQGRFATPVVVPPQVAILGAGRVRKQPLICNDAVVIHPVLPLSLTFDHRAATGGEAARFLAAVSADLSQK